MDSSLSKTQTDNVTRLPAWLGATSLTTATVAAAAVAAATAIAAAETTATAATTPTIFARAGFIDFQHAAGEFLAVELIDCRCSFFFSRHFDESETFRSAGVAILDHAGGFNRAGLSE